ncbi:DUF982 domain-containing protein [Mesorhizobium sp. ZMM04-5]|uniref:DUF982 domain-containing protein n=2 Tax=Mesorhizobium marinum TaxID=3228790 RepID=A0ABV3QWK3_9HYPH
MQFFTPVCVSSRSKPGGRDIEDLDEALRFLREWPSDRRGPVYLAAYNACSAARDGYLTVEEARKSLSGFARITGILMRDSRRSAPGAAAKEAPRVAH